MYLNTHSYFSFKYGVMSPEELIQEVKGKGISEFALTDINSTSGCLSFVRESLKHGIRPIVGIDFRNGAKQLYVAVAKNNAGFQEINTFLSSVLHKKKGLLEEAPDFSNAYVIYPFSNQVKMGLKENEYLGVSPKDLLKLPFSKWKNQLDKLVIMQSGTFRHQQDFNVHRLLRAIDKNTLLSKLSKDEQGMISDQVLDKSSLLEVYKDYPQLIENTEKLIDSCSIYFEFGDRYPHKNINAYNKTAEEDYQQIRRLSIDGIPYRYKKANFKIYRRLALELDIIKQKGYVAYFLVNWDIVSHALKNNWFYIGRGSGANSIVAYLLRITDVDPIELDLYFERFMNLYRKNPPDFDIDFSWRDRDDITRYMFETFGYDRVCLLATYNTFKYKAAVRELGKVFGLPSYEIDALSALGKKQNKDEVSRTDDITQLILKYAFKLKDIPSHLSVHSSGIIISEKPIYYYTATSMPPKGFPITHFDMVDAEDVGLYKFDILSQRGLGKIKDALTIIEENNPEDEVIDIHDIKRFFTDEKVKDLLRNGKAIGCFYVESPAMRMLLTKLRADHYLGLVAASSVIRPGVAKSGMMREYILRFRKPERRKDAHPVLLELMPETFGVMVYQEDVIKVAHYFADLTLAEADRLRRGMSGKFRSRDEFLEVKTQFFENCKNKGYDYTLTFDIWRQIESFAGYAFAKGHSASYAIESYQCLFLKAHYPLEYLVGVINNGGGFYSLEFYIHEARMHGAIIEAPCIYMSEKETIIRGEIIYLGFHVIKDLDSSIIQEILNRREEVGRFLSLEHFVNQVNIGLEQLKILIRIGAFRQVEKDKKKLLWQSYMLFSKSKKEKQPTLFEQTVKQYALPTLYHDAREDAFDEMEILKFPLKNPFELIRERPMEVVAAAEIHSFKGKVITMMGYLVTVKWTSTSKGSYMYFGTFTDMSGHFIDTVHFPPVANKYPFQGKGVYHLVGKVVEEFDFYSLEVVEMKKINYVQLDEEVIVPEYKIELLPI